MGEQILLSPSAWAVPADHDPIAEPYGALWEGSYRSLASLYAMPVVGVSNVGWISFNPASGGVTIDPFTGDFDGYAWGENIGWIHFQNAAPAYKVNTAWRPGAPVADAGPDQSVSPSALVTLDGSGSHDPEDGPLTYLWTQIGGPAVTLESGPSRYSVCTR